MPIWFIGVHLYFSLVFATPLCCALFPQKRWVKHWELSNYSDFGVLFLKRCKIHLQCVCVWPMNACMSLLDPAPCQSAAWNQSCRRKSGPSTQESRGSTSTKGYERAAPPPHPNTAITQLQGLSSPLCQPSSFSVPKLSLCLLHCHHSAMDTWELLHILLSNEMFVFVSVIVDFLWLGCMRSIVLTMIDPV